MIYSRNTIKALPYEYEELKSQKDFNIGIYEELLRYKCIQKLTALFKKILSKMVLDNFDILIKYQKLEDLIQRWCWFQYNNSTIKDSIIPYVENNNYDYKMLIEDIEYTTSVKLNDRHIKKLNKKIGTFLYNYYIKFMSLISNKNDINIEIKKKNQKDITTLSLIIDTKKIKIKANLDKSINNEVYNRLLQKISVNSKMPASEYDTYIYILILRYSYIDSNNQQLAINKKIKYLFKEVGVNFELFGSAINVINDHYCSLFYDIEHYFGSKGNFFNIEIKKGIYWCNPPYINDIMENAAYKIINTLKSQSDVAFLITIPIWDKTTQYKNIKEITKNYNDDIPQELFKDYPIYYLLKPYIKYELIIPKKEIPYFNYRIYKKINAVDTYMLLVYINLNNTYIKYLHDCMNKILYNKNKFFSIL